MESLPMEVEAVMAAKAGQMSNWTLQIMEAMSLKMNKCYK